MRKPGEKEREGESQIARLQTEMWEMICRSKQ